MPQALLILVHVVVVSRVDCLCGYFCAPPGQIAVHAKCCRSADLAKEVQI